jgi:hypothetical protein
MVLESLQSTDTNRTVRLGDMAGLIVPFYLPTSEGTR